ncbi:DUF669 domain-containing protein [Loigolactobacillus bifermentans]|uniref:DUF669 domain-containing protein n=1 Tax=Loigolactobacillus bifermentans DSM 20003 TaxID=1423726 RepID=A0A0R1H064_9LACO|nr:DUF669 domain-containing protein [Loigolactobacillus bifermentans]KRK39974.1 hypothetical protein FC07_GL001771 [Loigolactobacillus bifermentans DSM 20003]QGG59669.1 DUF669 domain-containing protein [Loigolactobacillus bifermentans]
MSLRDRAKKVMGSFDATKESSNGYENIPAGDYNMVLEAAEDTVYKSGYEAFRVKMSVMDGKYAGRTDSTNLNPDADNDYVADTAVKTIARLANAVGLELTDDDWEALDTLQEAFMDSRGKVILCHITESKNKKDPSNPYRNYDFEPSEQPEEIDIQDDDMPF